MRVPRGCCARRPHSGHLIPCSSTGRADALQGKLHFLSVTRKTSRNTPGRPSKEQAAVCRSRHGPSHRGAQVSPLHLPVPQQSLRTQATGKF
ncbi:hypothetical protein VULLAG_LOCUS12138 [Vulpes lagopus]